MNDQPQGQRAGSAVARAGLLALMLTQLAACGESKDVASESRAFGGFSRAVPVVTFPVQSEVLQDELKAVGTAQAVKSVTLFAEAAGVVTAVNFTADQSVAEDEVLVELDARDQELALELARVQRDEARLAVQRFESMNLSEANIPESQVDTARATLASAEIAVRQAEVALERRRVRAPFAGKVGITDVEQGDRIETATVITTLDDRSTLLVDFPVPESFVGQVVKGVDVNVKLWENRAGATTGKIVAVDSRIDPATRAFTARAGVDNTKDTLRPGMAFEIGVPVSRGEYLAVPDVSVQWGADGPYVWVADDAVARRVDVTLIQRLAGKLLIEADIREGTEVIAEGVQAVREGLALRILDPVTLQPGEQFELAAPHDAGADTHRGAAGG